MYSQIYTHPTTGKPTGPASTPANTKYIPTSILTLHGSIQQSHTHAVDPRNTADNKYHVETVRGFTSDGYAKLY
jgi:hypothetical protein